MQFFFTSKFTDPQGPGDPRLRVLAWSERRVLSMLE